MRTASFVGLCVVMLSAWVQGAVVVLKGDYTEAWRYFQETDARTDALKWVNRPWKESYYVVMNIDYEAELVEDPRTGNDRWSGNGTATLEMLSQITYGIDAGDKWYYENEVAATFDTFYKTGNMFIGSGDSGDGNTVPVVAKLSVKQVKVYLDPADHSEFEYVYQPSLSSLDFPPEAGVDDGYESSEYYQGNKLSLRIDAALTKLANDPAADPIIDIIRAKLERANYQEDAR